MATFQEWHQAGFTDLVPVIPPDAKLSPRSSIDPKDRGKAPGVLNGNGTWTGFGKWEKYQATPADLDRWQQSGANIGLRGGRFPGFDIDVLDPGLAVLCRQLIVDRLGQAPIRTGRAPKALLMYRTEEPIRFQKLKFQTPGGETYHVELLTTGKQYVVAGIHPGTRRHYHIDNLRPAIELPAITQQDVTETFEALRQALAARGCSIITNQSSGHGADRGAPPDQASLKAPSADELRAVVASIPNDNAVYPTRESWIRFGHMIKGAAQDFDEAGREIFVDWTCRWDGPRAAEIEDIDQQARRNYSTMQDPYFTGWPELLDEARKATWTPERAGRAASGLFKPLTNEPVPAAEKQKQSKTESGLADFFESTEGGSFRYAPSRGGWFHYDKGMWTEELYGTVEQRIRRIGEMVGWNGRYGTIKGAMSIAAGALAVPSDIWDRNLWLLNTPGGTLDLETGELRPHNPADMITKITKVAPDFGAACPLWLQFLNEATGSDPEMIDFLQMLLGYCLIGDTSEQALFFIYGGGGNGKSVFLNIASWLMGDYAKTATMEVFSTRGAGAHPTDLAMLAGSRMVTASETDGARWNDKRIKHLTGGDPITARFLYKPFFTYQPEFKILMVGNHQPSLHNVDDAMQRRIVIVPFTHKPRTVDPNLTEKLKAEGPAILAWAIQGCKKWRDRRASGGLPRPARVRASTADYFEEQDTVRQWVDECCTTGDPEHRAVTADLYRYWKMFCEGRGFEPGTSTSLSRALVRLGFEKWRSRNQKGFKGISLFATTTEEKWHTQPLDNTENLTGGATFNSKNGKSLVDKGFSPVTPLEPVHIEVFEKAEKKRHPAPKAAPEPDATTPPTPKYTAEQQAAYDRMMGDLNKQIKGGQK